MGQKNNGGPDMRDLRFASTPFMTGSSFHYDRRGKLDCQDFFTVFPLSERKEKKTIRLWQRLKGQSSLPGLSISSRFG